MLFFCLNKGLRQLLYNDLSTKKRVFPRWIIKSLGAFSENHSIAFKFNSSLFLLSDYFRECFLSPGVAYPPVHTVVASSMMSWVEGLLCAFWTLASKIDFTMPQLDFLLQNWWPWCPLGQYGANTRPMAASNCIKGSPRRKNNGSQKNITKHNSCHPQNRWFPLSTMVANIQLW